METTKVKVFNTATKGAKIKNIPLISEDKFKEIIVRNEKGVLKFSEYKGVN